jgi:hypothetical protein
MATKYWISTSSTSFTGASNWSPSGAPGSGDTLVFNAFGTANVETDLSTSLTGVTLIVEKSYTGRIGVRAATGGTTTYLVLDGGTLICGRGTGGTSSGTGSPLVMVNFGSTAATAYIYDSASTGAVATLPAVLLLGSNLTVHHSGGRLGVAAIPGETATLTYRCGGQFGGVAPSAYFGSGVTISDLDMQAGTVVSASNQTVTSATVGGGSYTHQGSGAHTTLITTGTGTVYYDGTGTITTLTNGGVFDRSRGTSALTITTSNLYAGCTYNLDNGLAGSITRTNINLYGKLQDMNISLPYGEKL